MEAVRERWTDDRMDDLNHKVDELGRRTDEGFRDMRREMDEGFRDLRGEMDEGFRDLRGEMDEGFRDLRGEMNTRFEQVDARFDAMQRTMLQLGGGAIAALLGLIATQI
jgi:hypothetical protein